MKKNKSKEIQTMLKSVPIPQKTFFLYFTPKGPVVWKKQDPKLLNCFSELTENQFRSLGFQSNVINKSLPLLNRGHKAYIDIVNGIIKIDKKTIKGKPSKIKRRYFKEDGQGNKTWITEYENEYTIPNNENCVSLIPVRKGKQIVYETSKNQLIKYKPRLILKG
jgi:hypothetical protein